MTAAGRLEADQEVGHHEVVLEQGQTRRLFPKALGRLRSVSAERLSGQRRSSLAQTIDRLADPGRGMGLSAQDRGDEATFEIAMLPELAKPDLDRSQGLAGKEQLADMVAPHQSVGEHRLEDLPIPRLQHQAGAWPLGTDETRWVGHRGVGLRLDFSVGVGA